LASETISLLEAAMADKFIEDKPRGNRAISTGTAEACCGTVSAPSGTEVSHDANQGFSFKIQGMDCAEEVVTLRKAVGPLVGGEERLSFDILNGRMSLSGPVKVTAEDIERAVARTGMRAEPYQAGTQPVTDNHQKVQTILTIASGICVVIGFGLHVALTGSFSAALKEGSAANAPLAAITAYLLAIALGGRFVVVKAWYAAQRLRPDMNLLMTIAVAGAIGIGDWLEAATVAFLFSLSLTLEAWSVGRARRAIETLLDLAPATVHVMDDRGVATEVPAATVPPGARFLVKPGDRIALDGKVVSGRSSVNQAPITGESTPVAKEQGLDVFAGTINGAGALEIESTKHAQDTTLAQIIRMVETAQSRRSLSEQWVEKFARYYTPVVIVLAVAVALLPPVVLGASWETWFYSALVLLVIACPCALVISTPVSIVAALASAARAGVLIKGGAYLEIPAKLKAIAFDKTGTLTVGRPTVLAVTPLNDHSEADLLARAASLEARSTHPLARAVLEYSAARGIAPLPAQNVEIFPGKGLRGTLDGRDFWLGSHRYLEERAQETPQIHDQAEAYERDGQTVVAIGNDGHVCGLIAIADWIRPEAPQAVAALRAAGVMRLVMLTGDNKTTAQKIAAQSGVDEARSELLPADKVATIEKLVAEYGSVAMVGDGINDAPAMATASLGIAMGAAGSDAAIEAADIALMSDDLSKLPWLIAHSRRALRIIRQNVAFALGVKAIFMVLTAIGLASLWGAIAADVGASLLVVANGLRLLRPSRWAQA
jgi:Cd2+/Zn2+-exporting ATPase